MNDRMQAAMAEATRLTAAGRLTDATSLIQRALGGDPTTAAPTVHPPVPPAVRPQIAPHRPAPPRRPARPGRSAAEAPAGSLAGRTLVTSFSGPAGTRSYRLYVPSRPAAPAMPLLVLLHGGTQDALDFATGTRMSEVAERHGFFVAYPEQPPSANPQRCWNWFRREDQQRGVGEPSLLAGIVEQIAEDHTVDASRVFVAGLSAGGAMAAVMAATYPDVFAGVGVHSGLAHGCARDLPSAFAAMNGGAAGAPLDRTVPLIVFQGDADRTVVPANADALVAATAGGRPRSDATVVQGQVPGGRRWTRRSYAPTASKPAVEHWTIHQSGHAWSGGDARGSYVDPQGPDASAEMVRFFLGNDGRPD